jgi:similar to spore coat protein
MNPRMTTHNPVYGSPTGRLAPHETLELHELLVLKTTALVKMKETVVKVADPQLQQLFLQQIHVTQLQIVELMNLLEKRPILP